MNKWETLESKYLVNDRYLKLRQDKCRTPEGHIIEPFYVAEYNDWVNCLVITSDMKVVMLKHYRHGIDNFVPEIIGGGVEENETPSNAIERELQEEIGYSGGSVFQTGISYSNPSSQTNKVYSFLAIGGSMEDETSLENGETLTANTIGISELHDMINDPSQTMQSMHLTSIFFALRFIERSEDENLLEFKKALKNAGF